MKEIQCFDYNNNAGFIKGLDLFAVKLEQSNGVLHFVPGLQVFQLDFLFNFASWDGLRVHWSLLLMSFRYPVLTRLHR